MSAERIDPHSWSEAIRWFHKADEDAEVARLLLKTSSPPILPAALHCQQAAEKLAKGILVAFQKSPPHIHSIARLAALIHPLVPNIAVQLEEMGSWTTWFVLGRYPNEYPDPTLTQEDVESALEALGRLREQIYRLAPAGGS